MQEEKKEKKLEDNEDVKKIKELIDNQKKQVVKPCFFVVLALA